MRKAANSKLQASAPVPKIPVALRKGAEACRAMLAAIEAHAAIVCKPASDSDADKQAAYAPRYAGTDVAIAAALDEYARDEGFRRALGNYLLQVAEGAFDTPSAITADDLLTDGGYRSEAALVCEAERPGISDADREDDISRLRGLIDLAAFVERARHLTAAIEAAADSSPDLKKTLLQRGIAYADAYWDEAESIGLANLYAVARELAEKVAEGVKP